MGARQDFIIVVPRCWDSVRRVLTELQPLIEEWIGPLHSLSVQNFSTGSLDDRSLEGAVAAEALPQASDEEIVAFYPSDPTQGTVLISHEGSHDLVVLSLSEHAPALDRLNRIWSVVGREADAALVGEELDVEDEQIATLLESGEIPAGLDLCDAAIVKQLPASITKRSELADDLVHGGRLLLK